MNSSQSIVSSFSPVTSCGLGRLDSAGWDRQLAGHPYATYAQTSCYGRFAEATGALTTALFLTAGDPNHPAGQLLLTEKFDYELLLQKSSLLSTLFALPARAFKSFSWNYGPILFPGATSDTLPEILAEVDRLAAERKVYCVRQAIPPVHGWAQLAEQYRPVFAGFGYRTRTVATVLLRVEGRSRDELWQGLSKDSRRTVRKAREQGVRVVEATTDEHIEAFYRLRVETSRRHGFRLPDLSHFKDMQRIFPPDVYRVFLTSHDGHWVSGQGVGVSGGNLILGGVCYSDYAKENGIYGNDLMQWHIIEWAQSRGARSVDWVGYFLEPKDEQMRGVNHYKLKWGGEVVTYDEYYKVFGPLRYNLIAAARKLLG